MNMPNASDATEPQDNGNQGNAMSDTNAALTSATQEFIASFTEVAALYAREKKTPDDAFLALHNASEQILDTGKELNLLVLEKSKRPNFFADYGVSAAEFYCQALTKVNTEYRAWLKTIAPGATPQASDSTRLTDKIRAVNDVFSSGKKAFERNPAFFHKAFKKAGFDAFKPDINEERSFSV